MPGFSDRAGSTTARENAASGIAFRVLEERRHPDCAFRGSIARPHAPCQRFRCALTGRQRMTRGHRDSLLFDVGFHLLLMPVYPGAPSGSHRSPRPPARPPTPSRGPPTNLLWRAINSESESGHKRATHPPPHPQPRRPHRRRSRRPPPPTFERFNVRTSAPPIPTHNGICMPEQVGAQQRRLLSAAEFGHERGCSCR